jgi:hypothetical protein
MYACKIYENLYSSSTLASARAVMDQLSPVYAACLKLIAEAIIYSEEKTVSMLWPNFPALPILSPKSWTIRIAKARRGYHK